MENMDSFQMLQGLLMFLVLVFSLSLHEFGHAWMAKRCGDPTAEMLGRLTINPMAHADLLGTIVFPLMMIFMPGVGRFLIGWAKPVPVSPMNFRHPRRDDILVSAAGPGMNLLLFAVFYAMGYFLLYLGLVSPRSPYAGPLGELLGTFMSINFMLAVFNLIPLAPLDGSWILKGLLPLPMADKLAQFDRYGFILLYVSMVFGFLSIWLGFFQGVLRGFFSLVGLPNFI